MAKTIAFIPARGRSKGIPNKNIKSFCGRPLIYWVISELSNAKLVDEVIIATDSIEIKRTVESFKLNKVKVYDRDHKNACDTSSTESVMLEYIEAETLEDSVNFILVQATSPFTQKVHFEEAISKYEKGNNDSILSCSRIKRFFWSESGETQNYDYRNRPRRQDFTGQLVENGAIYINSVKNIRLNKNRLSGKIGIYEMPEYSAVEIDEIEDWDMAEKIMYKHVLNQKSYPIKLVLTDVDGVLTDSGMYYSEKGDELKKFNTRDGKGFELLRNAGIKTGIITSENTLIVNNRAKKLKVDYLYQGAIYNKFELVKEICEKENITLGEVAYIGDDLNDIELLNKVGLAACPKDAVMAVKNIQGILILSTKGGKGVVREFVEQHIL